MHVAILIRGVFGKRRASVHEGTGGNQLLNIADVKPLIGGISNLCAFTKYGFGEARGTVQSRVGQELSERFRHIIIACVKKRLTEAVHIDRDQRFEETFLTFLTFALSFACLVVEVSGISKEIDLISEAVAAVVVAFSTT